MKGWSALLDQVAHQCIAELERLDPDNPVLKSARPLFSFNPRPRSPGQDAEDRKAAQLYVSGLTLFETGERMGRSVTYVRNALQRVGIPLRSRGARPQRPPAIARLERIRARREAGDSPTRIAADEGISRERVRQICAAHNITPQATVPAHSRDAANG